MQTLPDWMLDFSLFGMPFHFWTAVFFIFGSVIGSFLNVCIHRMPRGESVFSPPSHCPQCGYHIPGFLNIPIVTWLWLRGKCANCRAPISARYLFVELATALTFAYCWIHFGRDSHSLPWALVVLLSIFIGSSAIDFEHFIIPDEFTLGGVFLGFILSALVPALHQTDTALESLKQSALGIAVGFALIYGVVRFGKLVFGREHLSIEPDTPVIFHENGIRLAGRELPFSEVFYRKTDTIVMLARQVELADCCYREAEVRLRPGRLWIGEEERDPETVPLLEAKCDKLSLPREAMGFGDVKFMACIGAFLGWKATIFSLGVSSLLGSVIGLTMIALRGRQWGSRLQFGPYIAASAVIWIFGGYRWWDRFFGG